MRGPVPGVAELHGQRRRVQQDHQLGQHRERRLSQQHAVRRLCRAGYVCCSRPLLASSIPSHRRNPLTVRQTLSKGHDGGTDSHLAGGAERLRVMDRLMSTSTPAGAEGSSMSAGSPRAAAIHRQISFSDGKCERRASSDGSGVDRGSAARAMRRTSSSSSPSIARWRPLLPPSL